MRQNFLLYGCYLSLRDSFFSFESYSFFVKRFMFFLERYISFRESFMFFVKRYKTFGKKHRTFGERFISFVEKHESFLKRYISFGKKHRTFVKRYKTFGKRLMFFLEKLMFFVKSNFVCAESADGFGRDGNFGRRKSSEMEAQRQSSGNAFLYRSENRQFRFVGNYRYRDGFKI